MFIVFPFNTQIETWYSNAKKVGGIQSEEWWNLSDTLCLTLRIEKENTEVALFVSLSQMLY